MTNQHDGVRLSNSGCCNSFYIAMRYYAQSIIQACPVQKLCSSFCSSLVSTSSHFRKAWGEAHRVCLGQPASPPQSISYCFGRNPPISGPLAVLSSLPPVFPALLLSSSQHY